MPHFSEIAGCPVRFVTLSVLSLPPLRKTSYFDISSSIWRIRIVRARCARRYSTAGMKRDDLKVFGHELRDVPVRSKSTSPDRVTSSKDAAASASRMKPIELAIDKSGR